MCLFSKSLFDTNICPNYPLLKDNPFYQTIYPITTVPVCQTSSYLTQYPLYQPHVPVYVITSNGSLPLISSVNEDCCIFI